ncbi:MAG: hypothetical protein ABI670_06965 [Chloroflexota bacterium]
MKYIKGFFAFWYDFIVGDAWEVAAGVLLTLILLYTLTHTLESSAETGTPGVASYGAILLPIIIVALLGYSLWRVRRTG